MDFEKILFEKQGSVGIVRINNKKALNALNSQVIEELDAVFDLIAKDDDVDVVVLSGSGKAFVAGADIKEMILMNAMEGKEFGVAGANVFRKIELFQKPVIAAINGFALGGGCELAMACDIRIASAKAKFGQPEVSLGITPGFSGTQRLSRLVGVGIAKEMIYTAKVIDADEAYRIGLVNHVVEPEKLIDKALEMANVIAKNEQIAVRYSKECINRGLDTDMDTAIQFEASLFGICFSSEDQKEGMKAFLEKRAPKFKTK